MYASDHLLVIKTHAHTHTHVHTYTCTHAHTRLLLFIAIITLSLALPTIVTTTATAAAATYHNNTTRKEIQPFGPYGISKYDLPMLIGMRLTCSTASWIVCRLHLHICIQAAR